MIGLLFIVWIVMNGVSEYRLICSIVMNCFLCSMLSLRLIVIVMIVNYWMCLLELVVMVFSKKFMKVWLFRNRLNIVLFDVLLCNVYWLMLVNSENFDVNFVSILVMMIVAVSVNFIVILIGCNVICVLIDLCDGCLFRNWLNVMSV